MFVVLLKARRYVIIQDNWVESKTIGELTKVFYSPNEMANPRFDSEIKFMFDAEQNGVYEGILSKHFGKCTLDCPLDCPF